MGCEMDAYGSFSFDYSAKAIYNLRSQFWDKFERKPKLEKVDKEVTQKQGESAKSTSSTQTNKGHLTTVDIGHFKQLLLKKHQEIIGNVSGIEGEALKAPDGDISKLMDNERKLLRKIEDALEHIEQGTYGICEATGVPISKTRLEAKPWARYCVEYARKLEQNLVSEQGQEEKEDSP